MSWTLSREQLVEELSRALGLIGSSPLLLHSDLARIGMLGDPSDKEGVCRRYAELLDQVWPARTLLVPTFNYDFCQSGLYDVQQDPSQVGVLTEYYRRHWSQRRTQTPVFNFCVLREMAGFSLTPVENCFGPLSTFAQLVEQEGWVAFLGAPFSSNTFLHLVEERCDVPYRYHKRFEGVVRDRGKDKPVSLLYRVRPLDSPSPTYDWPRLEQDLIQHKLLYRFPVGKGRLLLFRAWVLQEYWEQQIKNNPNYLLVKQ